MMDNFAQCIAFTLEEEGGYSDDDGDPGGPTKFGITQATLTHWRGKPATEGDVQALTVKEATAIYQAMYWQTMRCWALPSGVDLMVMDFGVNAGPGTSGIELQQAVGTYQDGLIGPVTALAARGFGPGLIEKLAAAHKAHYESLDAFPRFGSDWLARLDRCTALALTMAPATK